MNCEHSDEEHQDMAEELQKRLMEGDISALIPSLSNDQFMMLLQAASAEVFIRAKSWDEAKEIWKLHDELVRGTFLVDKAEDSDHPEEYKLIEAARNNYHKMLNDMQFIVEAADDLNKILDQYGVQKPTKPDDDLPGFYL